MEESNETVVGMAGSAVIEGISVADFDDPRALFHRIGRLAAGPGQSTVFYLNIHVANLSHRHPELKRILQRGSLVYCDGAGIVLGARMSGQRLSRRLTAADWIWDFLQHSAENDRTVFLLGSRPAVAKSLPERIARRLPRHTVVGVHHGHFAGDAALEQRIVGMINAAAPDVLMVGLGTPLQELWIERHRHELKTPVICAMGACMDFMSGATRRCPRFMGEHGLEWAYRLYREPRRLFRRYVIGNGWFLTRIAWGLARAAVRRVFFAPAVPLRERMSLGARLKSWR